MLELIYLYSQGGRWTGGELLAENVLDWGLGIFEIRNRNLGDCSCNTILMHLGVGDVDRNWFSRSRT